MTTADVVSLTIGGIGAAVALVTFMKAILEYTQQGRQKRAEHFSTLRRRLKETPGFADMAQLLDMERSGDEGLAASSADELASLPFKLKRDYLGFFEEVAISVNSGLVKPQVAHYMFGYYAVMCWESDAFWTNVDRLSSYWSLFRDFCERMKAQRSAFRYRRKDFRF